MKKRILSALLVLCLACGLVSTAWAADGQSTPETAAVSVTDAASGETAQEESASDETVVASAYPARTEEQTVPGTDVTVQVGVPEGALPEDAKLTTALVGSSEDAADDQAVADVASELDKAEVEYDGFVALDISFVDADGNKVEPLQPVSVNFTLPAELLPEDVDASTLEVQHLEENAAGEVENVATVADAADTTEGTVTVEGPAATLSAAPAAESEAPALPENAEVTAEFTVDGFSSFVITWNENNKVLHGDSHSVSFSIVDTDGNELSVPSTYDLTYDLPDSGVRTFDKMVNDNQIRDITIGTEQYTFRNATFVLNGTERHPIVSAERIQNADMLEDGIRFYDSVFPGETGYYTKTEGDGDFRLELVYERKEDSETDVYEPDPVYTKTAVTNDGGKTYDLALTVSGDVGESSQKVKLDVLFIVDQSGSMGDGAWVDGEHKTYQKIVSDAAGELARGLASNENIDARFAVVTFSDSIADTNYYDDAILRQNWTRDAQSVITATDVSSNGGTNYEAGMMAGRAAMLEARPDAMKYVIFLSDGEPTYHYTGNGNSTGGGNHTAAGDDTAAYAQAAFYNEVNGFFTVGVGSGGASADSYLESLRGEVKKSVEATVGTAVDSDNFSGYTAEDPSKLTERFTEIQAQITNLSMHNVVISDTLSQWVEPVEGAQPYLVIKDQNGNTVTTENDICTIRDYDPDADTVSFTADFDDSYELKQGYTYELHLKVQPTQTAYETFAANGSYPAGVTGDDNTGTYAGKPGFYSNAENAATLSYATDISDHALVYPMPVVQVPSTSLTIHKTFVGLEDKSLAEAAGDLTFTVTAQGYTETKPLVYDAETKQYSVTFSNLVVTKTYTVTENSTANPAGFDLTGTQVAIGSETPQQGSSVSVTMALDAAQNTVTFTNSYTPQNKQLTVTKQVTGDMGSRDKAFTFTLSLTKTEEGKTTYYGSDSETIRVVSSTMDGYTTGKTLNPSQSATGEVTYSFQLQHDKNIVLEVPYGYTATLHEEADGYTASFTVDGESVEGTQPVPVMNENHTVAYTNRLDPVAPTGLESNHTAPYTILVTVAGVAGLALIGGIVARRRRHRME